MWSAEKELYGQEGVTDNKMKSYALTDVGRVRHTNQDYLFASDEPIGNLPNLYIVADGMGGHNAGDYASRCAVGAVIDTVRGEREFNPIRILNSAIEKANLEVYTKAREDKRLEGMGTTLVAVTIVGKYAYVANVGDSRLYVIGSQLLQITRDHSLVGEMVRMGELTEEEGRMHPDKNIITRALGINPTVKVDFFDVKLEDNNSIMMCSDGLSNMVSAEEILKTVQSCEGAQNKAQCLIDKANENGGKDNIAVIVIEPFTDEVNI